jgi:hypothetical protein
MNTGRGLAIVMGMSGETSYIKGMSRARLRKQSIWSPRPTGSLNFASLVATLVLVLMASTQAFPIELHNSASRDILLRQGGVLDLQIETRQRREAYQEQQQRFREQDRLKTGEQQPRLEIPRMQNNCQAQVFGRFLQNCR